MPGREMGLGYRPRFQMLRGVSYLLKCHRKRVADPELVNFPCFSLTVMPASPFPVFHPTCGHHLSPGTPALDSSAS